MLCIGRADVHLYIQDKASDLAHCTCTVGHRLTYVATIPADLRILLSSRLHPQEARSALRVQHSVLSTHACPTSITMLESMQGRLAVACAVGVVCLLISLIPTTAVHDILQIEPEWLDTAIESGWQDTVVESGWQDTVLSMHNKLRARHQAPELTWSKDLEASAQNYAEQCVFEHSGSGDGENLAIGTGMNVQDLVRLWADEEQNYNYGESDPSNFHDVGHFTQMVWVGTTTIGCGFADCGGQGNYLVCRYSPPGNYRGEYADNVLP